MTRSMCAAAILLSAACGPAAAGDWLFVGISRPKLDNDRACPKFEVVTQETRSEQEAKALLQAFLKDPDRRDISVNIFGLNRVAVVYSYPGRSPAHGECRYTRYSVASADSEQRARAAVDQNTVSYKEYYTGPPEVLRVWSSAKRAEHASRDELGDVQFLYLVNMRLDGSTILARMKNAGGTPVLVSFDVDGRRQEISLGPGESGTLQLGRKVQQFSAQVARVAPMLSERTASDRVIDAGKALVRSYAVKDGVINSTPTAVGVRG